MRPAARLPQVDGLRAVAALWVVAFHGVLASRASLGFPGAHLLAASGWKGVSLFFVISGFCLYLPVAGGRGGGFSARRFLGRRARRVLPAYYVSLLLVAALHLALESRLPVTRLGLGGTLLHTLAHATMLHTVIPAAFNSLNGVYWSLGVEWELYLAFPLLVALAARRGLAMTLALIAGVNTVYLAAVSTAVPALWPGADPMLIGSVLPNQFPARWIEFGLGMLAAQLFTSGWLRRLSPLWPLALAAFAAVPLAGGVAGNVLTGLLFFFVLCVSLGDGSPVGRLLAARPLVAVGAISYSLYLVHEPILNLLAGVARTIGLSATATIPVLLLALPLVLAVAWGLYRVAEVPVLRPAPSGGRPARARVAPVPESPGL